MKGFMFSMEALSVIAVVILILSIYFQTTPIEEKRNLEAIVESNTAMEIYFNSQNDGNINAKAQTCNKIIDYDSLLKKFIEKKTCRVVE